MSFLPKVRGPDSSSQALGWWPSCEVQAPRTPAIPLHYMLNNHIESDPYKPIWTLTHFQCGINPNRWVNHHHRSLDQMVVDIPPTTLRSYPFLFEIDTQVYLSIQFRALQLCFHCFRLNFIIHIQSLIFLSMHKIV